MAVDEPEGDPYRGEEKLNSPKTYLHVRPYPEQHVRSYADSCCPRPSIGQGLATCLQSPRAD